MSCFWTPCGNNSCNISVNSDGYETQQQCMSNRSQYGPGLPACNNDPECSSNGGSTTSMGIVSMLRGGQREGYDLPCCFTDGYQNLRNTWKDQKKYTL